MIVWPTEHTTFVDWTSSLRQLRPDIDINPRIDDEKNWKEWANRIIQSQVCQTNNCPRPDGFSSWKLWAMAFIKAFSTNA